MCIMNTDIPAVAEEPPVGTVLANGGPWTSSLARGTSPALPRHAKGTCAVGLGCTSAGDSAAPVGTRAGVLHCWPGCGHVGQGDMQALGSQTCLLAHLTPSSRNPSFAPPSAPNPHRSCCIYSSRNFWHGLVLHRHGF